MPLPVHAGMMWASCIGKTVRVNKLTVSVITICKVSDVHWGLEICEPFRIFFYFCINMTQNIFFHTIFQCVKTFSHKS